MLAALRRHRRASVAVEVALLVPIYVITIFGMVDVGRFFIWVDQARRCALIAGNASAQLATISATDTTPSGGTTIPGLTTILNQVASSAPAAGWGASNGLIITALTTNAYGYPSSEVQQKYPTTLTGSSPYTCGSSFNPPVAFIDPNDTVVIAEVIYSFTPFVFLGPFLGKTQVISLHDYSFFRVRQPTTFASAVSC